MVLEEDSEATLSYAIIAIDRDTWLGIVLSRRVTWESLQQWLKVARAKMYNNLVVVEEEEEVAKEVEVPYHRLLDLVTNLNPKLECMR